MKPRGRRIAAAKFARPVEAADLFDAIPPAEAPVRQTLPLPAAPQPVVPQPAVLLPAPPHIGRPRIRQLWYAVVFPELTDPQRAASLLQRLALCAQQFTPLVSIEPTNALLLEIKGSVKLFGSLAALHESIDAAWMRFSLRAHSAAAPATLAALWLARAGKRACIEDPGQLAGELAQLPVACTSWDPAWLRTLRAMGVTRMGELLRLPRSGVSRRLGPAAVLDLDIALARQAAPRRSFVPRERFRERCDFETEIATVVYLQKALEPVVERCARFLRERQAGVQAVQLKLRHRVLPATRVRVNWASVTSERRRLADVLNEKLHRLELAAPVRGMELESGSLQPLSPDSLDVFAGLRAGGMRAAGAVPQLVERLRARLGEAAVYGLVSVAEHRPEAAWQRVHEPHLAAVRPGGVRAGGAIAADVPRPVWLLDRPLLLSTNLQRLLDEGLILEQGPERIESGWWDGKGVARDYYIARQTRGARWWVFQERRGRSWYLHGVFA